MRLFSAVEVPPLDLEDLRPLLGGSGPPPHLTLRFLGEVPEDLWVGMASALERTLAGLGSVRVVFGGLGAFPSAQRPRVVWLGVLEGGAGVGELARRVEDAAASMGLGREDRPFVPHVTLRRLRPGPPDPRWVAKLLEGDVRPRGRGTIAHVDLYESRLHPDGARHVRLVRIGLGPPPS